MELGSFCFKKQYNIITLQPKSIRITGIQKGFIQSLEIYQSIESEEDLNEVSYVFPTDNNLCIYGMKFQVGDETIKAELMANQNANETFKEAKKIGRTVAKTETISPGITEIKIGNVPKGKIVSVIFKCAFTSILKDTNTILAKIPLQATEPNGSVTDLYNLPTLKIDVDITISQLQTISDVYTNCNSNYEKIDDYNGKLTIESTTITDENILIMTELTEPVQSQMIKANNTVLISTIPQFEPVKNDSKEYVFLIDCSASMIGKSIQKAKESLHLFLSKLPEDSYFNIIRFGTTYKKLFEHSSEKVESTIKEAKKFIDEMRANLGGTEMLSMLNDLFIDEPKIGCQRQIFIITDGEVYQRQKVVQKVTENRYKNRIFAIGLGHGADAGFLDEIAELTNGKSDFVFNKNDLPNKVSELFDLSLTEAASDVEIHIEGNESFEAVPYPHCPLLPGVVSHIFVYSKFLIQDVLVTGKISKTGEEIDNMIDLKNIWVFHYPEKSPVFALFAWNQLRNLTDNEKRSVQLSIASGVMCKYTSYIAVSDKIYVEDPQKEEEKISTKTDVGDSPVEGEEQICESVSGRLHRRKRVDTDGCDSSKPPAWVIRRNRRMKMFAESMTDDTKSDAVEDPQKEEEKISTKTDVGEGEEIIESESGRLHRRKRVDTDSDIVIKKRRTHKSSESMTDDTKCVAVEEPRKEEEKISTKTDLGDSPVEGVEQICESVSGRLHRRKRVDTDGCDSSKSWVIRRNRRMKMSAESTKDDEHFDAVENNDAHQQVPEKNVEEIDMSKVWKDDCSVEDIIRLQSRDGFWDLPSLFISKKCKEKLPEIPGIDFSELPIVRKRVISTVFTLAYLAKFNAENAGRWKYAKEKGIKWLKRMESTINWEQIINENISCIDK